jgi:hypothetical protein
MIMKQGRKYLAVALVVFALGCDDDNPNEPSPTGPIEFRAQLTSGNEVPPITNAEAPASGTATIVMDVPRDASGAITGGGTIDFTVQFTGFPANTNINLSHIHRGAAGANGPVVVNLNLSAANPFPLASGSGTLTVNDIQVDQTLATEIANNPAGFYFNSHTALNPGGAVRGQLVRQ